jgi:hypothetical protein
LYQALETEHGGIQVYETALRCVVNDELREAWQEYLEQTRRHEQGVRRVFEAFARDPEAETPGRRVVRHIGVSLCRGVASVVPLSGGARPPSGARVRDAREDRDQLLRIHRLLDEHVESRRLRAGAVLDADVGGEGDRRGLAAALPLDLPTRMPSE